jgi:hypothetical protein
MIPLTFGQDIHGGEMPPDIRDAVRAAWGDPSVVRMRKPLENYGKGDSSKDDLRSKLMMAMVDAVDASAGAMAVGAPLRSAMGQLPSILRKNRVGQDFLEDVEELVEVFWKALRKHMPKDIVGPNNIDDVFSNLDKFRSLIGA